MPNLLFLLAAAIAAGIGYWSYIRETLAQNGESEMQTTDLEEEKLDMIELDDIADNLANLNSAWLRPC